jgi:hypothetical protein
VAEIEHVIVSRASGTSGLGQLSREMDFLNTPPPIQSHLLKHEGDHGLHDYKRDGWYGLMLAPHPWLDTKIVVGAFYLMANFNIEEDPERAKATASGPGFRNMSGQDWYIYQTGEIILYVKKQQEEREEAERQRQQVVSARDPDISRIPNSPTPIPLPQNHPAINQIH